MSSGPPPAGDEPGADHEAGGDPVCWLHELCPECGAMPSREHEEGPAEACWRCGHQT